MDLLKIRDQLDVIDKEIVRLFEERMALVRDVAAFKIETGKPVFDKEREGLRLPLSGNWLMENLMNRPWRSCLPSL